MHECDWFNPNKTAHKKIICYTAHWSNQPLSHANPNRFLCRAPHLQKCKCVNMQNHHQLESERCSLTWLFSVFFLFVCVLDAVLFSDLYEITNKKYSGSLQSAYTSKEKHLCGLINFMEPCDVIIISQIENVKIWRLARINFPSWFRFNEFTLLFFLSYQRNLDRVIDLIWNQLAKICIIAFFRQIYFIANFKTEKLNCYKHIDFTSRMFSC